MDPLTVNLLGSFQLRRGDVPVAPPASLAARALLAYLALAPERVHPRNVLAGLFWPDTPNDRARRRLSQALWRIRESLKPHGFGDLVVAGPAGVTLDPSLPIEVDANALLAAVDDATEHLGPLNRHRALRRAVDSYRGGFLERFDYEWVDAERDRVHAAYLRGLELLVGLNRADGKYEDALTFAQRYAFHERYHEENHREIMRLLLFLGRPRDAIEHYDRLADDLTAEFGTDPEIDTQALALEIAATMTTTALDDEEPETGQESGDVPFVGRRAAKRTLNRLIGDALLRRGSTVLIEGDPGVGVTRLLEEAAGDASWNGLSVLVAKAQAEFARPYGVIRDLIASGLNHLRAEQLRSHVGEAWLRDVSRVVPQLGDWLPDLGPPEPLREGESPDRVREALTRTLVGLSFIRPHLLTIDNLQWVDGDSLRLLTTLADDLHDEALVLCIGYRAAEARERSDTWTFLTAMNGLGAERIDVEPFTEAEADMFLSRLRKRQDLPPLDAERIYRETGGNALFMLETVQALHHAGDEAADLPITDEIQATIASRYAQLSDGAQTVAATLAVFGRAAGLDDLVRFSALGRDGVHRGLDELIGRSVVRLGSDGYRFEYEQLTRGVYALISARERRRIHRVIASWTVDERPTAVEELAYHFEGAGDAERTFRYAIAAAQHAASVHAYATAAAQYRRAMQAADSIDVDPVQRAVMYQGADEALEVIADMPARRAVLEAWESAAAGSPELGAALAVRWSAFHVSLSDFGPAVEYADRATALAEEIGLSHPRASALLMAARAYIRSNQPALAVPALEKALHLEVEEVEAVLWHTLGSAHAELQAYEDAAVAARRALTVATDRDDPTARAKALGLLGVIALERADGDEAEAAFREAIATTTSIGHVHDTTIHLMNLGGLLYHEDRIHEALDTMQQGLASAERAGSRRLVAGVRANLASVLHRVLGDNEGARHHIERALTYYEDAGSLVGAAQCAELSALMAASEGDHDAAAVHISGALVAAADANNRWRLAHTHRAAAMVAEAAGDLAGARTHLATALEIGTAHDMRSVIVSAQSHDGYLAMRQGDGRGLDATAEAMKAASSGVPQQWTIAYHHGAAAELAGDVEQAARTAERAIAWLDAALRGFSDEVAEHARTWVPRHRELQQLHERHAPTVVRVRLPKEGVPTGRPLLDHEFVDVSWTLRPKHDETSTQRRRRLLGDLIEQAAAAGASPRVDDLAEALGASLSTVKRDLARLRSAGAELRTRGTRGTSDH